MFVKIVGLLILFIKLSVVSAECEKTFIVICESFSDVKFNKSKHTWTELLVQRPKTSDFTMYYTLDMDILNRQLKQLKGLIIQKQLTRINPNAFTYSIELNYLILYDNILKVIETKTFYQFQHLEKLSLSNNNIEDIESKAFSSSKIEEIDLSNNYLSKLNKEVFDECEINKLVLNYNRLKQISSMSLPTSLKILKLDYNLFHYIPSDVSNLKSLEEFTMSHNEISKLTASDLNNFSLLKILDLSFNNIDTANGTFDSLGQLEHLDLAHNELPHFIFTPALTTIVTSKDFILLLAHNNLQYLDLPSIDEAYESTLRLTLSLNPWNCNSIEAIDKTVLESRNQYLRTACDQWIYSYSNVPCCIVSDLSEGETISSTQSKIFKKQTENIDCDVYKNLGISSY